MRRLVSLLGPVVMVVGVVGCGGGAQPTGSDTSDWVDDVCGRMIALDHEVAAERTDLDAAVAAASDAPAMLTSLDHYLGEVSSFAGLAADDIDRLGVPALDGDSSSRLHRDIDTLFRQTDAQTTQLSARVNRALSDVSTGTSQVDVLLGEAATAGSVDGEMQLILTDYRQVRIAYEGSASCQRWVDQLSSPTTATPIATTAPTTTMPPTTEATTTTVAPTTTPPTTVPETTVPPTTVPPTTVPVTVDPYIGVRELYLAAADEYNPKFDAVWNAFHDADDYILYRDMPTYCEQSATLEREWYDRMSAIPWPPDAVDEARAYAEEAQVRIGLLDQCAAAPGTRAGEDALLDALTREYDYYFMAVDALRVAIGLPALGG